MKSLDCRLDFFSGVPSGVRFKDKVKLFIIGLIVLIPKRYRNKSTVLPFITTKILAGTLIRIKDTYYQLATAHNFNSYEMEMRNWFNLEEGDVFFDVGANMGFYSVMLAKKNVYVVAFEPYPPVYKILLKNIEMNKLSNLVPFNLALSDYDGSAQFNIKRFCGGNSLTELGDVKTIKHTWVNVIKLDTLLKDSYLNHIDLIKIDTEGSEPEVLRGAVETIDRFTPRLIIETLPVNRVFVEAWLKDHNYVIKGEYSLNILAEKMVK